MLAGLSRLITSLGLSAEIHPKINPVSSLRRSHEMIPSRLEAKIFHLVIEQQK